MEAKERFRKRSMKPYVVGIGLLLGIFLLSVILRPRSKTSSSSSHVVFDSSALSRTRTIGKVGNVAINKQKSYWNVDDLEESLPRLDPQRKLGSISGEAATGDTDYWDVEDDDDEDDVETEASGGLGPTGTASEEDGNQSEGQAKKRPPDFIIIGARKCGTRALLAMIALHPQIVSAGQEVHYFDREENYKQGLNWYIDHMSPSLEWQMTTEKSPSYFDFQHVPERIKKYFKDTQKEPKLVLIVRNPVDRVVSDFTQGLSHRGTDLADKARIQAEFRQRAIDNQGNVNQEWRPITISKYSFHLRRWWEEFHREQLFIVNGDNLLTNPITEMKKVSSFLNLDNKFDWNDHLYYNETRGFYCLHKKNGSSPCLGSTKGRTHPEIDAAILEKLRNYYKPFNKEFKNMTGLDVDWDM